MLPWGAASGMAKYIYRGTHSTSLCCYCFSIDLLKVHVNNASTYDHVSSWGTLVRKSAIPLSLWVCQPLAAQAWPQAHQWALVHCQSCKKSLLCSELLLVLTLSLSKNWVVHRNQAFFHTHKFCALFISGLCLCIDWRKKTFCLTALCSWEIIYRNISTIIPIYFYFSICPG